MSVRVFVCSRSSKAGLNLQIVVRGFQCGALVYFGMCRYLCEQ